MRARLPCRVHCFHPAIAALCLAPAYTGQAAAQDQDNAPGFPYLLDVTLGGRETLTAQVPATALLVDAETNRWQTGALYAAQPLTQYPAGFLLIAGEVELTAWLSARILIDSGEVRSGGSLTPPVAAAVTANGQPLSAAAANVSMLRELDLRFTTPYLTFDVGKQRYTVAHGLLYDDYAVGVGIYAHTRSSAGPHLFSAQLSALLLARSLQDPTPRSPFIVLDARYEPSYALSLGVFGAYFRDVAGSLTDVIDSAVAERIIVNNARDPAVIQRRLSNLLLRSATRNGGMGYVGMTLRAAPAPGLQVSAAALGERGQATVTQDETQLDLRLAGAAAHFDVSYELRRWATLGAFGFALSGDAAPPAGSGAARYNAYLGVAPYLTWTGLFFTGGLNQSFFSGRAMAAGVNGHGVAGGGIHGVLGGLDAHADVRLVYLSAMAPSAPPPLAGGGLSYGWEADVVGEWTLLPWLTLAVEGDVLWPGNFFPGRQTAWRLLGQIDVAWSH